MNWLATLIQKTLGRHWWMETYSGSVYYPGAPRAQDVRIIDIAHHQSMICRFTGACRKFYSVAEHSWHVSYVVPPHLALQGLLHDAPEAYLTDIGRPLKNHWLMYGYKIIEKWNWEVIAKEFGLPLQLAPAVHEADNIVLMAEREVLMPLGRDWGIDVPLCPIAIHCWAPEKAEQMFLDRFYELTKGRPYTLRCDDSTPAKFRHAEGQA